MIRTKLATLYRAMRHLAIRPRESVRLLATGLDESSGPAELSRAYTVTSQWEKHRLRRGVAALPQAGDNPIRSYFDSVTTGRGVWKWLHYFDLYHRHLHKFVGREVVMVEIGVYSGGSLDMWKHYFGSGCRVHGVDIEESCRCYEDARTTIHIGDQADRSFWRKFRQSVPELDIVIDDGGHSPEQQMVTLEELLPHLRPGGVYICEDVLGPENPFGTFAYGIARALNVSAVIASPEGHLSSTTTPFQAAVDSVHFYPFVVVVEKRAGELEMLSSPKRGTEWQPFTFR